MNCHFPMDKFHFFSKNPKCQFILFQHTNVHLCAKFGDLKPTVDEKQRPWTCFWARHRNKIQQGNCNFLSTKCFINVYRWMINRLCCRKLEFLSFALGPTWGLTKQNLRKSWCLHRFCSDSCVLWATWGAMSNPGRGPLFVLEIRKYLPVLHDEKPIGLCTFKMLIDLRWRALSHEACGGSKRACQSESTHAQLVAMMSYIVALKLERVRDGSVKNTTCSPALCRELTEQKSTRGGQGGNVDLSVDSAWFHAFTR